MVHVPGTVRARLVHRRYIIILLYFMPVLNCVPLVPGIFHFSPIFSIFKLVYSLPRDHSRAVRHRALTEETVDLALHTQLRAPWIVDHREKMQHCSTPFISIDP